MALGKYHQALKDFDKVIELKPDFSAAVLQRASLLLKQGQLDKAHIDFESVVRHSSLFASDKFNFKYHDNDLRLFVVYN